MSSVATHILAVGSGKGGVGKSTTALNFALLSAKSGKRTALIDMDPLSNLGVILDIDDLPERSEGKASDQRNQGEASVGTEASLDEYRIPVLPRLDLLFSRRAGDTHTSGLYELIFHRLHAHIQRDYDLLIIDLPAGISYEENLQIFPRLSHLLVVTNAEPTSHVSAGGYIKAALEMNPRLHFLIWNNKFEATADPMFNPRDLWGNYNRYAPEDLLLAPEVRQRMYHVAFVPPDPALNVLKAGNDFRLDIMFKIRETLHMLRELVIAESEDPRLSLVQRKGLRHFFIRRYADTSYDSAMAYCEGMFSNADDARQGAREYIQWQRNNPLADGIGDSLGILDRIIDDYQRGRETVQLKNSAQALSGRLLKSFALIQRVMQRVEEPAIAKRFPKLDRRMLTNTLALTFFYYSMLRLLDHDTVQELIRAFIPKKERNGRMVRDRHRQIMLLVQRDQEYHQRFIKLMKNMFPLAMEQLLRLSQRWKLEGALLKDEQGVLRRSVYLKLLSELMNDLINAGLGVQLGVRLNRAAREMSEGFQRVLEISFGGSDSGVAEQSDVNMRQNGAKISGSPGS